ncbi:MAG: VWA domain-containing protein [Muribaculaceae bacterium]|nr:VWA domain-containing protein [Muribaculaceae bacterium]
MISFANPHLLYLLIVVPVLGLLYALACYRRKRALEKFGKLSVLQSLMPDASRYMGWVKTTLALCALTFIIIALARPYTPSDQPKSDDEQTARGIEVMLCVDVSNSMLASSTDDPGGVSRLQRAKFLLERLIDKMHDDKVGLIVFAGDAYTQLPITSDYISAKMFLNGITTDMVPTQGTAIGAALDMAINSFTPESEFQKAIVLITDGENFEDNATEVAKRAADAGIEVDVIGIGSGKGAPIPVKAGLNEYMKDYNGNEVRTALNEQMASEIAKAGDGIYVSGASSAAVSDIDSQLDKLAKTEYKRSAAVSSANELFPIAALIALIILVIDGVLSYSKLSWLRDINFFTKKADNEKR